MVDSNEFSGQTILVTGAGSGIGRETSIAFAEAGGNVVLGDVDTDGGKQTAATIAGQTDGEAVFVEADVTDGEDVEELIGTCTEEFGSLDVAFNNAGIGGAAALTDEISTDDWHSIIDTNLSGVWRCMREEIPVMVDDGGGAIINAASILGQVGTQEAPAYTAAKHGVVGLTKVAALERATDDVRVNAVCPGYVDTAMISEAGEEMRGQLEMLHAMDRLGNPEEIASTVLWLASDSASFVTGEAVAVDGGYLSR